MNEVQGNPKRLSAALKRKLLRAKQDRIVATERERHNQWIGENHAILVSFAAQQFQKQGRGVVVVDDTVSGVLPPIGYLKASGIPEADKATNRMVRNYFPEEDELVVTILRPGNAASAYRLSGAITSVQPRTATPTPQENRSDLDWIEKNLPRLSFYAALQFRQHGEGAVLCDRQHTFYSYMALADLPADANKTREFLYNYSPDRQLVVAFPRTLSTYIVEADCEAMAAAFINLEKGNNVIKKRK